MSDGNFNHTDSNERPADWELLAYLDGQAEPEVAACIEASPALLARARELDAERANIRALLYRRSCPSPVELGAFLRGQTAGQEVTRVRDHLIRCPHCARELSLMRTRLPKEEEPVPLLDRLRLLMGSLNRPDQMPLPNLRGLHFRGEVARGIYHFEDGSRINWRIEADDEHSGSAELSGLFVGRPARGATVTLWQQGDVIAETRVNEEANFHLAPIPAGDYELVIQGDDFIAHILPLDNEP